MDKRLIISLDNFPEEGLKLRGELDPAFLELDIEDIQSTGAIWYEFKVQIFDTEMLIQGRAGVPLRYRCVRCLANYDDELYIDPVTLSEDTTGKLEVDITEALREELLLDLPNYPKCENAGLECEILQENLKNDDFGLDKEGESGVKSSTQSEKSIWDALDKYTKP